MNHELDNPTKIAELPKQLPIADDLEKGKRNDTVAICTNTRWRCVTYQHSPDSPVAYWCLLCKRWVSDGDGYHVVKPNGDEYSFMLVPKKTRKLKRRIDGLEKD